MKRNDSAQGFPITIKNISAVLYVPGEEAGTRKKYNGNCIPYQLIYILEGKNNIIFDFNEYQECPDTLRFMPKNRVKANYEVTIIEKGACIDVCFDTIEPIEEDCFVKDYSTSKKLRGLFLQMEKLWRTGKNNYYQCMALLYQIIDETFNSESCYLPKSKQVRVQSAVEYINEHFSEYDFDYSQLALSCGISNTYLRKLFNAKFGIPPNKYIMNMRISYACDLLNSGLYAINEVACMSGYENVFYFSRVFKQTLGLSPSEYIKSSGIKRFALQNCITK